MFLSEWCEFPLALQEKKLDDSLCLGFVETVHVPDMLPSLFISLSG